MDRPGDDVETVFTVFEHQQTRYLCFIDRDVVKHAMLWMNSDSWRTACGICLGIPPGYRYAPGRLVSVVDLRDVVMGIPTCLECVVAELEKKETETVQR
jgi:hypothetical protein